MLRTAFLAALALVFVMSLPSYAKTNEAREGLRQASIIFSSTNEEAKVIDRRGRLQKAPKIYRSHTRSANVLRLAERYLGTNPTRMRRLWCANFIGMIERQAGRRGSGSDFAKSYASYGKRVSHPQPGDIAVMGRKGGGHVGYFVGWAPNGKAILISGNSRGGKVAKGQYAAARIFAWRRPA